jgi:AcrR family transcriptional regulator
MNNPEEARRGYVSPLRAQQAQATRWAVLQAAARLFAEVGYVGTSIAAIAVAAGVSRATVSTAVGTKPVVLKQAYDSALAGDDDPTPIADRATTRSFREQTDPYAVLDAYAAHATTISARVAGIAEAIRGAAGADPDARALWAEIQTQRDRAAHMVVDTILGVGTLRDGLDADTAADLIWALNDATLYYSLVHVRHWSHDKVQAWRAQTWKSQLLPDEPRPAATGCQDEHPVHVVDTGL